jgi:hypothetical protein
MRRFRLWPMFLMNHCSLMCLMCLNFQNFQNFLMFQCYRSSLTNRPPPMFHSFHYFPMNHLSQKSPMCHHFP